MASLMSSNGHPNTSCSTKATRSAGLSVSSTASNAVATRSPRSASSAGSAPVASGSSRHGSTCQDTSRVRRGARSRSRLTRETTVVNQASRFSMPSASARASRNQVSWTASSASCREESRRVAMAWRRGRTVSKRRARIACSVMSHPREIVRHYSDGAERPDVTRQETNHQSTDPGDRRHRHDRPEGSAPAACCRARRPHPQPAPT